MAYESVMYKAVSPSFMWPKKLSQSMKMDASAHATRAIVSGEAPKAIRSTEARGPTTLPMQRRNMRPVTEESQAEKTMMSAMPASRKSSSIASRGYTSCEAPSRTGVGDTPTRNSQAQ